MLIIKNIKKIYILLVTVFLYAWLMDNVNSKMVDLQIEFQDCPATHDVANNKSSILGRYYINKGMVNGMEAKEYLGTCTDVGNEGVFKHDFKPTDKWKFNENDAQRFVIRYVKLPSGKELVVNEKEPSEERYSYKDKFISQVHQDDINRIYGKENVHNGYTIEKKSKYIEVDGQVIQVPNSDFEVKTKHLYVDRKEYKPFKYCSLISDKKIYYYYDIIQRVDGSTYKSDGYEENNC